MDYHQLELDEESRNITTFMTPDGLMRWKVLIIKLKEIQELSEEDPELVVIREAISEVGPERGSRCLCQLVDKDSKPEPLVMSSLPEDLDK